VSIAGSVGNTPLASVVIPVYNGGELLAEAVQSVLNQTYANLELLVVDDASTEDTSTVLARFADPRLKFLRHARNQGPDAARLTALNASRGEIVAFLDQDDLFHPRKLETHVSFLLEHPETGLSYNSHFTLFHPSGWITGIWRPPEDMTLADVTLGFPIPPSSCVSRRSWVLRPDIWDRRTFLRGREFIIFGRMFLAGCRFSMVDRALNYRRIHLGRRLGDPLSKCNEEQRCLQLMLDDPRCPAEVRSRHAQASAANYLVWAITALVQDDTSVGQALLREAVRLDPGLLASPSRLLESLVHHAVVGAEDVELQLRLVFSRLPREVEHLNAQLEWTLGRAHLIRGIQHVIWGRTEQGAFHLARAAALRAEVEDGFLPTLCYELQPYELEFGQKAAHDVVRALGIALRLVGGRSAARRLNGTYHLDRAFRQFRQGMRQQVPPSIAKAAISDPRLLANRGLWSVLLHTALPRLPRTRAQRPHAAA